MALVSDQPFSHESWTGQKNLNFIASFFPKWSPARATELATRFRCPLEKKVKTLSKSFHLEETRLTQPDRLVLFMGLVAWTLPWCLLIGLQKTHTRKAMQIKKHGRRAISLFRLGFDRLQQVICNPKDQHIHARQYARCLLS
ncbi:MAG: hypothetical protein HOL51_10575 [Gemmatimonadetes bacterium]|nr:hypothetical protein [Gemmatimonadota bacterium]